MKKTDENWKSPASTIALAKATHYELLRLARQMLSSSEVLRGLFLNDARLRPNNTSAYLWKNATPAEERVALAISEATLAISALLDNMDEGGTGALGRDGLTVAERLVPLPYFHQLLARYAELTSKQAVEIWNQFVELVRKRDRFFQHFHVTGEDNDRVILQIN